MAGAASLETSRLVCSCGARRLLDLLVSRFLPNMLLLEPFPRLAESSVTVAPVNGGEVDEGSCLICDDVLEGTFKREFFCCDFSGTAGPDSATFSFVDETEGPSIDGGCGVDSEVAIEEGILSKNKSALIIPGCFRSNWSGGIRKRDMYQVTRRWEGRWQRSLGEEPSEPVPYQPSHRSLGAARGLREAVSLSLHKLTVL